MAAHIKPILQPTTGTQERRTRRRKRVLKAGQIITNSNSSTVDCIIRDVSDAGARLRVASTISVPETFLLLIKSENAIVPVQRVWRNAHEVGVTFVGERRVISRKRNI